MREEYCPVCGACVYTMYVRGPESARVVPCGHDVHPATLLDSTPSDSAAASSGSEDDSTDAADGDTG